MLVYGAGAAFFLPGAGADPIWSELKPESAPGPQTSRVGATKKVVLNYDEIILLFIFLTPFFTIVHF